MKGEERLLGMNLPHHVGIIMDGNGRWALRENLPRSEGHRRGLETVRTVIDSAKKFGVKHLTLYTFSTENFMRPADEVQFLMSLLKEAFFKYINEAMEKQVRVRVVGALDLLDKDVREVCEKAVEMTKGNDGISVYFAIAYGGRREILDAVKKALSSSVDPNQLTEETFRSLMYSPEMPDIDLVIRTAGEQRISNFFLWHIAYSEFYFVDRFWPEFTERDLLDALNFYSTRERRFGRLVTHSL